MESRVKLLGHPIHPMLVVFPLGLLTAAAMFDLIYRLTGVEALAVTAFYVMLAGIAGGLLAAVFGFLDYRAIPPSTRARRIGRFHGFGNVVMLGFFGLSAWLRWFGEAADPPFIASVFAYLGAGLGMVTGWLGGELVDRLGVGVDDGAHLDAPSSLKVTSLSDRQEAAD